MTTMIPHSEYIRITQINLSPETIAVLLNEAEAKYSNMPRHFNSKRVYPFWKICQVCSNPFPCHTKEQAIRNKTCSKECANQKLSKERTGKMRKPPRMATCQECGQTFKLKNGVKTATFCSYSCRGTNYAKTHDMKTRAANGHKGWTPEGRERLKQRFLGENNPAWKGGVTVFKKHGNYVGVRYVRCPQEYISMARKDGYVMEHRLVVAQAIGRPLLRVEVIHHIDHDPTNNCLSNLQLFANNRDHKLHEHHGTPPPIWQL